MLTKKDYISYLRHCKICGNTNLKKVIKLNEQYISATFIKFWYFLNGFPKHVSPKTLKSDSCASRKISLFKTFVIASGKAHWTKSLL